MKKIRGENPPENRLKICTKTIDTLMGFDKFASFKPNKGPGPTGKRRWKMKELEKLEKATIERETEKAVLANVRFGDEFDAKVWLPKSQIQIDSDGSIWAPGWLIEVKSKETCDEKCRPHTVEIATVRGEFRVAA